MPDPGDSFYEKLYDQQESRRFNEEKRLMDVLTGKEPPPPLVSDVTIAAIADKAATRIWQSTPTLENYAAVVRNAIREALGR